MKYKFYGVNFKTELTIGLLSGILFIIVWIFLVVFYYWFNHLDSILRIPFYIFFGAMFLGLSVFIFFLRFLGNKYRKLWLFNIDEKYLIIEQKNKIERINIAHELKNIMYVGTNEMRYLTIKSTVINYKIRVGTSFLAPFSRKIDITSLDEFINAIENMLQENQFLVKKVKIKNNVFEYRFKNADLCK